MVREYAVDPEAVATCDSPVKFLDDFGRETGRLIAPLPKANRWVSAASRALSEGLQSGAIPATLRGARRLELLLTELQLSKPEKDALFSRVQRPYDGTRTWMENALDQHARRPFQAVIAAGGGADFAPDDADSLQPLFTATRGVKVPRRAADLVAVLAPVLALSSRVVFVDPYFDPEEVRFRPVVKGALRELAIGTEVSIVTGIHRPPAAWPGKIRRYLQPLVPVGIDVTVLLLEQRPGGPKLHARYVLTDAAGVAVETGLDEGLSGQETDLHLLARKQYDAAWKEYVELEGFNEVGRFRC